MKWGKQTAPNFQEEIITSGEKKLFRTRETHLKNTNVDRKSGIVSQLWRPVEKGADSVPLSEILHCCLLGWQFDTKEQEAPRQTSLKSCYGKGQEPRRCRKCQRAAGRRCRAFWPWTVILFIPSWLDGNAAAANGSCHCAAEQSSSSQQPLGYTLPPVVKSMTLLIAQRLPAVCLLHTADTFFNRIIFILCLCFTSFDTLFYIRCCNLDW